MAAHCPTVTHCKAPRHPETSSASKKNPSSDMPRPILSDPTRDLPPEVMELLWGRFICSTHVDLEWPELDEIEPGDPHAAVRGLGEAGHAYIRALVGLLYEAHGYLPVDLASRITERVAYLDAQWALDVQQVHDILDQASPPTSRGRKHS